MGQFISSSFVFVPLRGSIGIPPRSALTQVNRSDDAAPVELACVMAKQSCRSLTYVKARRPASFEKRISHEGERAGR
jgi:hypothetical protein